MLNSFTETEVDDTEVNREFPASPHPEGLLHRITLRIRQSLELQKILETTAAEVRAYLGTDRVKIYCFHEDSSGEVIAEALNGDRLPSLLGLNFPADDIPPYARELFIKARQRVAVDVASHITSGLTPLNLLDSEADLAEQDFRYRPVDPCHVEYLTAMHVKSSVVVPILHQEKLWGLLVSHHSEQRTVTEEELQFIGAVADQVELAIAQSILLRQVQAQADQEAKINCISALLHTIPTPQLQDALEEAVKGLQGSGGRLYLLARENTAEEFYTWGEQPVALGNSADRQVEQHLLWQQYLKSPGMPVTRVQSSPDSGSAWSAPMAAYTLRGEQPNADCWAINDIYKEPLLRSLVGAFQPTQIRGMMIVPLRYGQQTLGCFTVFRQSVETERLWAGRRDPDPRQMVVQMSFEAWRELKSGQSESWTEDEKRLARSFSNQFATAVQQYHIHSQVQQLNAGLESQVQARTTELEQLVEQQHALFSVVTKIHNSLDLGVIFQTTTRELRELLQSDRVGIYRFNPDWSGEFIAESVGSDWVALVQADQNLQPGVNATEDENCLLRALKHPASADTYLQKTQGGVYARGTQFCQVDDIYAKDFSRCYLSVLESYQCRAYVIVPIFQAADLWGLLATYQNSGPRQWTDSEVSLMVHTAVQLGVATQQAELLVQTRQQTNQLAATLEDLQQTQSQLIQTEKMSSLGQLVAGVAHEINNPVNFINGNLLHAREYAQELLDLLRLYQQHYPNAHPEVRDRVDQIDLDFIAEDLPKLLSSMQLGADRIRQIVLSLRNFSRVDQAEVKPVNVHDGIDSTLLILQHRLRASSDRPEIEVIKDYGPLPQVECYAGQLNQVFMNILTNAIDALEERDQERSLQSLQEHPSRILIRTQVISPTDSPASVVIRIADNGPGVGEATKARLFDPFFTTKAIGRGTGLGLSISYQIIQERHKGNLRCISKLGKGTEFQIQIPLRQTPGQP
ncbi:MAG TPA: GAF domain-containing protein [Thermosynechococcaceae cyanobacterium]